MLTRFILSIFSVGSMVLGAGMVSGQNYPNKPLRVVTSEAGGSNDIIVRLIVPGLTNALGQPVIIENRPSIVTPEIVAKALPDGYTLLFAGNSLWIGPLLIKANLSYDQQRYFSPIILVATTPNVLVVHPSLPVKSVKELIALAKAKPGALNYATGGASGAPNHLAAELFNSMAGVNIVRIPYKSAVLAITDLIAGRVQLSFPSTSGAAPHIKSGSLRALAVASAEPSALAPGLPTMAASGLPGYASESLYAIFAPPKTPEPIINRLNQEIVRVLYGADVKEKLFNSGVETVGSSPEKLAAAVKADTARMSKVIKDAGITAE